MQIESLWLELAKQSDRPVFRRIDEVHPLDLYAGVDLAGDLLMMLVSDTAPPASPSFDALEVRSNIRNDGRWALLVRLQKPELSVPFAKLCQDLVEATSGIRKPNDGPEAIIRRLSRWRRLMQVGSSGLTDAEARGLIGELVFLESVLIPSFGPLPAVRGWTGPTGAAQDFRITGMLVEVKACQLGSHQVTISSLEQLDSGSDTLYLVVTALSPSPANASSAITLRGLAERIRTTLTCDEAALDEFNVRLEQANFDKDDQAAAVPYQHDRTTAYHISCDFPRLTRGTVSPSVLEASYVLDLSSCHQFEIDLGVIGHGNK
jgi:hypothetical protein